MRGGNLSNESARTIGIRFERVLKTEEGYLNRSAKAYLESVVGGLDVNVYIITTGDRRKCLSFLSKWGVPFFQVIEASSAFEVADIVRENDMLYYFDLDRDILNNVNSRGGGKVKTELWTSVEV